MINNCMILLFIIVLVLLCYSNKELFNFTTPSYNNVLPMNPNFYYPGANIKNLSKNNQNNNISFRITDSEDYMKDLLPKKKIKYNNNEVFKVPFSHPSNHNGLTYNMRNNLYTDLVIDY